MSAERCPACDRPVVTDNQRSKACRDCYRITNGCAVCVAFCWRTGSPPCEANRVDWRARYLDEIEGARALMRASLIAEQAATAERDRLRASTQDTREGWRALAMRWGGERDRLRAFVETVAADMSQDNIHGEQAERVLRGEKP